MSATLVEDVLDIVAEKARIGREKLALDAKLTDLNIASLDVVEIVFALEEKFDVQLPYNANAAQAEFNTVGDVVKAVQAVVAQKA